MKRRVHLKPKSGFRDACFIGYPLIVVVRSFLFACSHRQSPFPWMQHYQPVFVDHHLAQPLRAMYRVTNSGGNQTFGLNCISLSLLFFGYLPLIVQRLTRNFVFKRSRSQLSCPHPASFSTPPFRRLPPSSKTLGSFN